MNSIGSDAPSVVTDRESLLTGTLWPEPVQMHNYLDRWVAQIHELSQRLRDMQQTHQLTVARYANEVSELQHKLDTSIAPLQEQIQTTQGRVQELVSDVAAREQERLEIIRRLASILEIVPTRATTLDRLLSDIVVLVDETKEQFRRSL